MASKLIKIKSGILFTAIFSTFQESKASHCVQNKGWAISVPPEEIYTMLGKFDLDVKNEEGVIRADISFMKIHSDWSHIKERYDADITIFTLKDEIKFTNFIQPICLPDPSQNVFDEEGIVAGYGFSDTKIGLHETKPKYVEIESVQQDICLFSNEVFARISSPRMFCAGKRGKNPCRGDSGGGWYVKSGNKFIIVGIVSSSIHKECYDNEFVLFTNVPMFVNWIKIEMGFSSSELDVWDDVPLKCKFEYDVPNDRYECFVLFNLKSSTPNVRISHIEGQLEVVDSQELDTEKRKAVTRYTDVDTVVIKQAEVTYIPDLTAANKKFPNYKQLFIVFCGLKFVERSKLAKMRQLTTLNFYGNEIEHLEPDVFNDLKNLEILAFVKNKIKVLPQKLLWNLVNLEQFWSYENPVEEIPIRFFKNNKNINQILIGTSNIKKIGVNFKAFPKLNHLNLKSAGCIDVQGCSGCDLSIADVQDIIDANCV